MDSADAGRLAQDIGDLRRALIPEFVLPLMQRVEGGDLSMIQMATLYILDEMSRQCPGAQPTLRELAARIDRSVSATSRMVDQLVRRGLLDRREDPQDRRARRIALAPRGCAVLRDFEGVRARAQLQVMSGMNPEQRALVVQAMALLGDAARRRSATHR